ncbi:MAG: TM2 domain-containing protein [Nitrospirota bacterium]
MYCRNCGNHVSDSAHFCEKCGTQLSGEPQVTGSSGYTKEKITAGLLGIFLGWLGVHRFYLGYTGIGVLQIFATLITAGVGGLWGIVEGILILTGNINKDAQGRPLVG